MQTLVVLARDPRTLRDLGLKRYGLVALLLTNLVTGPLALPFFQALMVLRFFVLAVPNPGGAFEHAEIGLAVSVTALGAFSTLWCGWQGMRRRALTSLWPAVPMLFVYQLMISAATWMGLWDLIWRPYHWHKTEHGVAQHAPGAPLVHAPAAEALRPA